MTSIVSDIRQRPAPVRVLASVVRTGFVWQLLAIVLLGIGVRLWLGSQTDPGQAIRALGIFGPLFAVALQCVTTLTPVGSSVIPTLNGMLFPLWLAVALNMAGGLAAGVVMYYMWRRGDRELHIHDRLHALPRWARRFVRSDLLSLIIMRMLPWAGANVSTMLASTHRVPMRIHIVSVAIGSLPGSIIYALIGTGLVTL